MKPKIYIIPTKDIHETVFAKSIKLMSDVQLGTFDLINKFFLSLEYWQPQHMYFTSDEPIKSGDWVLHYTDAKDGQFIFQCNKDFEAEQHNGIVGTINNEETVFMPKYCHKIVASTNKNLLLPGAGSVNSKASLPLIPFDFLVYFVEKQGKNIKNITLETKDGKLILDQSTFVKIIK